MSTPLKAATGRFILTLSCPDQKGIVAAVATFLLEQDCNIIDSAQFGDAGNGRFFMRVYFAAEKPITLEALLRLFGAIGERFEMQWRIYDATARPRVLLMVSKFGHCLNDLLYRTRIGALPIDIRAIVSNHRDFYQLAASHDIPFHYLPVTADTKARQEERLLEIFQDEQCDLLVLARYMQILSPRVCVLLKERAINIHHSFLPSFQTSPRVLQYARSIEWSRIAWHSSNCVESF